MSQKISTGKIIKLVLLAYVAMVVVNFAMFSVSILEYVSTDERPPNILNYIAPGAIFFGITIFTYVILSTITEKISADNKWTVAKKVFLWYVLISFLGFVLAFSKMFTFELGLLFPWHSIGGNLVAEMITIFQGIAIFDYSSITSGLLISVLSLITIYYFLHKKFRKT